MNWTTIGTNVLARNTLFGYIASSSSGAVLVATYQSTRSTKQLTLVRETIGVSTNFGSNFTLEFTFSIYFELCSPAISSNGTVIVAVMCTPVYNAGKYEYAIISMDSGVNWNYVSGLTSS